MCDERTQVKHTIVREIVIRRRWSHTAYSALIFIDLASFFTPAETVCSFICSYIEL